MEKIIKFLMLILSFAVLTFVFYSNDFGKTQPLQDLFITADEFEQIKSERHNGDGNHHCALTMDDHPVPFDTESKSFILSIDSNSEIADFNPTISIKADSQLDYTLILKETELSEDFISKNESIEMLVYSDTGYESFQLRITNLPILTLNLDNPLAEENNPIGNTDQRAQMTLYNNDASIKPSKRRVECDLNIRLRGHSSRAFPKKQYRLNLREFTIGEDESNVHESSLGMREDDDWILYSPYNDPEKMRNTFSNHLWYDTAAKENRFGFTNGTESRYVELFIDDRY